MKNFLKTAVAVLGFVLAEVSVARADVATPSTGGTLFLVGVGLVAVIVVWLLIRGALSLSGKNDKDDDGGFGVLEGVDDEDDEPRKKR